MYDINMSNEAYEEFMNIIDHWVKPKLVMARDEKGNIYRYQYYKQNEKCKKNR